MTTVPSNGGELDAGQIPGDVVRAVLTGQFREIDGYQIALEPQAGRQDIQKAQR